MNRRLVMIGASFLALGAGAAIVGIAGAQPVSSLPLATDVVFSGGQSVATGQAPADGGAPCANCATAVTQEPAAGFVGACLVDHVGYLPTLPLGCYAPGAGVTYGAGFTKVSIPAQKVLRPYSTLATNYDSYQALVTCYPHNADGSCPLPGLLVSHSCCDYGATMTSLDGKTAQGYVSFQ